MKKSILFIFLLVFVQQILAQKRAENIIVITTDGFRWQELFGGVDTALANHHAFNEGAQEYIHDKFGDTNPLESRKKLLPFIWSNFAEKGQIFGNRHFENKVNVSNPYFFSYPGYSEIFCGFADTLINSNGYKPNPNPNVLEFMNRQPGYKNKVAAFSAWEAMGRILNKERSGMTVISAFENTGGGNPTDIEKQINSMRNHSFKPWGMAECLDVFTHYAAVEHFKVRKPKVMYIAYGETDEWAHAGMYKSYLDAAHQFDEWVSDLWTLVQSTKGYQDNTVFFITTDHGRGDLVKHQWKDHGSSIIGADEIWFLAMGPGVSPKGEIKQPMQLYQKQFAQTIAAFIGLNFLGENVSEKVAGLFR
ncbi:MAG: alkaline phosphatase family protein [Ginsengibacter sp.]